MSWKATFTEYDTKKKRKQSKTHNAHAINQRRVKQSPLSSLTK